MKHYEVTIQTAKETIVQKYGFCHDKFDAESLAGIFMEFEHPNETYEITQIREIDETEMGFEG